MFMIAEKSMRSHEETHVESRTAREWLSKRRQLSSSALRRTRRLTARLRRKEKLSDYNPLLRVGSFYSLTKALAFQS